LLAAAIFGIHQVSQNSYAAGSARAEVQENARVALARLAAEIREAGYDPTLSGLFPGLTNGAASDLTFNSDWNGNGVLDANETVRYYRNAVDSTLHRSAGGVDEQLIEGAQTLSFTYLDQNGATVTAPVASPSTVRSIRIQLTSQPVATVGSSFATPATFTTQVRLRNAPIP